MCRPTKRPKPAAQFEPATPASSFGEVLFKLPELPNPVKHQPVEMEVVVKPTQPSAPAPNKQTFVYTTFDMVSDEANAAAIGFDSTGALVQIRDATIFGEEVLPKYFRHRNVTSFYRQLNSYGFRTIKTSSLEVSHTFMCELFRRDRPDLLPSIVRKKASPMPPALAAAQQKKAAAAAIAPPPKHVVAPPPSSVPLLDANPSDVMRMIFELQQFQKNQQARAEQLEANIQRLSMENQKILHEGQQVIANMQSMVKDQSGTIEKLFGPKASDAFVAHLKSDASVPQVGLPPSAPVSPVAVMEPDLFAGADDSMALQSVDSDLLLPEDDLFELETLLAFEEDGFSF